MTTITATEFKQNFGKYLVLAQSEDIEITKNGKTAARLTSAQARRSTKDFEPVGSISELFGILHGDVDIKEARWERLKEKCGL